MLTDQDIFDVAEPFGAFEFGDAQGDKRKAFARAVIEANNAKVLADLKPDLVMIESNAGNYPPFYLHNTDVPANPTSSQTKTVYYSADTVSALIQRNEALEAKYSELIMCVGNKYPNESRHETARRYLNNAECADRLREPVAQTLKATP